MPVTDMFDGIWMQIILREVFVLDIYHLIVSFSITDCEQDYVWSQSSPFALATV